MTNDIYVRDQSVIIGYVFGDDLPVNLLRVISKRIYSYISCCRLYKLSAQRKKLTKKIRYVVEHVGHKQLRYEWRSD